MDSSLEQLERLAVLKEKGLLSNDEFNRQKQLILNQGKPSDLPDLPAPKQPVPPPNALKPCRSCRELIARRARRCPHCRTKQSMSLWVAIPLLTFLLLILNAQFSSDNPAHPTSPTKPASYRIGESFTSGDYEIRPESVVQKQSFGYLFRSEASDGGALLAFTVKIKNISTSPKSPFTFPSFALRDAAGITHSKDIGATAAFGEEIQLNTKALSLLNPGLQTTQVAVFDVPLAIAQESSWTLLVSTESTSFNVIGTTTTNGSTDRVSTTELSTTPPSRLTKENLLEPIALSFGSSSLTIGKDILIITLGGVRHELSRPTSFSERLMIVDNPFTPVNVEDGELLPDSAAYHDFPNTRAPTDADFARFSFFSPNRTTVGILSGSAGASGESTQELYLMDTSSDQSAIITLNNWSIKWLDREQFPPSYAELTFDWLGSHADAVGYAPRIAAAKTFNGTAYESAPDVLQKLWQKEFQSSVFTLQEQQYLSNTTFEQLNSDMSVKLLNYVFYGSNLAMDLTPILGKMHPSTRENVISFIEETFINERRIGHLINDQQYDSLLALLKGPARFNSVVAQNFLGLAYLNGWGIPQDAAQAREWFNKAGQQDYPPALYNLGTLYRDGISIPQNQAGAFSFFEKSAASNFVPAIRELGRMYYWGKATPRDVARAYQLLLQSADAGDSASQLDVANLLFNGEGTHRDESTAIEYYHRSIAQGNSRAFLELARHYAANTSYKEDLEDLLSSASGNFDLTNMVCELALDYKTGFAKFPKDLIRAMQVFQTTHGTKTPTCLYFQAGCYLAGDCPGFATDASKAATIFQEMIDSWDSDLGYIFLGKQYLEGNGVPVNYSTAFKFVSVAANRGPYYGSQYRLAQMYENGQGTPINLQLAKSWYSKAAMNGSHDAELALERINQSLSSPH